MISIALMFADNRFGYVDNIRYGFGFLTVPIYWLSDAPSAITNAFDDSIMARSELVEKNKQLEHLKIKEWEEKFDREQKLKEQEENLKELKLRKM